MTSGPECGHGLAVGVDAAFIGQQTAVLESIAGVSPDSRESQLDALHSQPLAQRLERLPRTSPTTGSTGAPRFLLLGLWH